MLTNSYAGVIIFVTFMMLNEIKQIKDKKIQYEQNEYSFE